MFDFDLLCIPNKQFCGKYSIADVLLAKQKLKYLKSGWGEANLSLNRWMHYLFIFCQRRKWTLCVLIILVRIILIFFFFCSFDGLLFCFYNPFCISINPICIYIAEKRTKIFTKSIMFACTYLLLYGTFGHNACIQEKNRILIK